MTARSRGWLVIGAVVIALPVLAQLWYWSRLFTTPGFLAHSDLYEYFLPAFLSPMTLWSSAEFAGMPVYSDPQVAMWYPVQLIARAVGSWSLYVVSLYVIAATGASAYAWQISRSKTAAILAGLAWPWSEFLADAFPHLAFAHAFAWFPWVLFGVEKVAETRSPRWVIAAALFVACFGLTGQPQAAVYCGYATILYTFFLWRSHKGGRRLFALYAGVFLGGAALAAVELLPLVEISTWIARDRVSFPQFAGSFMKQPHELMAGIIPQFCHERREAPQYVGILTLWLAFGAVAASRPEWRARFWMVLAIVCLLLGLGSQTPLATLAYEVPLYDRFRVVTRHLALYSFAIIALGALGIAALRDGRLRGTRAALVALIPAGAAFGGLYFVTARPDLFTLPCDEYGIHHYLPEALTHVWLQAGLITLAAVCLMLGGRQRWRRGVAAALPLLLAFDILNSHSERVDGRGVEPPTVIAPALTRPSVHARLLKQELAPLNQRLLPLEGSALDPVVPGVFARLWRIPSLGGYNPMMPGRMGRLTRMNNNGSVRSELLLADDVTLDMFAVRYVIVRASELTAPAPLPVETPLLALPTVDRLVGPSDCRPRGPMSVSLSVAPVDITGVVLSGEMRCGDHVHDREEVAVLTVHGNGNTRSVPVRAAPADARADDTALWVPHQGPAATPRLAATDYRVSFPQVRADRITIQTGPDDATLFVDRVALVTADGRIIPLTLPSTAVAAEPRWREHRRFATSRTSDRDRDDAAADELEYVVLENTRARPRAWFAGHVIEVADEHAIETVQLGRTRDGVPLDVATTAFVPPGEAVPGEGGRGSVEVVTARDGAFRLRVTANSPGMAVLSELHHPGWSATLDGQDAALRRVDFAIMGVAVPAGTHDIVLRFSPIGLKVGGTISVLACLGAMVLLIRPPRRWYGA